MAAAQTDAAEQVSAVDVDGVTAVTIGTVAWFVAFVVLVPLHAQLRREGHLWWIPATLAGWLLGVLGVAYCRRRRRRLRKSVSAVEVTFQQPQRQTRRLGADLGQQVPAVPASRRPGQPGR